MYSVVAYQIASYINIKTLKADTSYNQIFSDSDELFLRVDESYVYIFQYGMISFFNMTKKSINEFIREVKPYCSNFLKEKLSEEVKVIVSNRTKVEFNHIELSDLEPEKIRLVMLNTSQSVALNRYSDITESLIIETNEHTKYLEKVGKLNISGVKLKRFIGKVLNIKNRISENLYIFDAPEITLEDEKLNKLNMELKIIFDLEDRYHLIEHRLDIIKENLELFKDILEHKESSKLEWIIIVLILVEVIDMIILKLIKYV